MGHHPEPAAAEWLRARAQVARLAVREGILHPADALALTVWPTRKVLSAERQVKRNTIASRAYSTRLNA